MKPLSRLTVSLPALLLCVALPAVPRAAPDSGEAVPARFDGTLQQTDAGPNHRTYQRAVAPGNGSAGAGRVVEIATGMNYWDKSQGQLVPSQAEFVAVEGGFVASRVQHPSVLSADLNVRGALSITTPDGLSVVSTPLAVGLLDTVSGRSIIIGALTNCAGVQTDTNQVLYENAFSGVCGSIVFTIQNGSFEQDLVLTAKLDPADYAFPANSTCILLYTELYDAPEPDILTRPLYIEPSPAVRAQMAIPDILDQTIGFGEFVLGSGRAYVMPAALGTKATTALVQKELKRIGDRLFLVESVDYASVRDALSSLPPCAPDDGSPPADGSGRKGHFGSLPAPPKAKHLASSGNRGPGTPLPGLASANPGSRRQPVALARAARLPAGVCMDYLATLSGTISTNIVFASDTTYFVSGPVYVNGQATIEATCFKYKTNAFVQLNNAVVCKTSQFRPAVFTAIDDDSVGDSLAGNTNYTGVINASGYANPALSTGATSLALTNFRFCYAKVAVLYNTGSSGSMAYTLNHSQIINCIQGIQICGGGSGSSGSGAIGLNVNNCLLAGVQTPVYLNGPSLPTTLTLVNCTVDQAGQLVGGYTVGGGSTGGSGNDSMMSGAAANGAQPLSTGGGGGGPAPVLQSTNCVYANVTNSSMSSLSPLGNYNGFYNAAQTFGAHTYIVPSTPFQGVGAGNYYLTDACGFRNAGTNFCIPAAVQTDLKKRTTYAPLVTANALLTTSQTLWPQAQRNTGPPDLGYHYDPMDWAFGFVLLTNATFTVTNGTVLGLFGTNGAGYGLAIGQNAALLSQGAPNAPNWCVQYNTVQEQPANGWVRATNGLVLSEFQGLSPSVINCRFTDWSVPVLDAPAFSALTNIGPFNFQDCEFHGGLLLSVLPTLNLTNCLLERVYAGIEAADGQTAWLRNNLIYGGSLTLSSTNSGTMVACDNLFDKPAVTNWGGTLTGATNAYVTNYTRLQGPTNDLLLSASPSYQTGPLGNYYQLTNSGLINAGSAWASNVMLFHYTVATNLVNGLEVKEGGTMVDVGYHYVATDAYGNPIDTDGDGFPDYLEDTDGDGGGYDSGDLSDWQTYGSPNGLTSTNGLQVFTPLK